MLRTRNRNAERVPNNVVELGQQNQEMFNRLTQVMEQLAIGQEENRRTAQQFPVARPEQFEAPHYDGTSSVEKFIQHFQDVAHANQWTAEAALLHLRCALRVDARNCGSAESIGEVFVALRSRFGLTPREARAKLFNIKREKRTSLHEHAAKIEELMAVAYPTMQIRHRMEMAVDNFSCSLNNPDLQKHLLAVRPHTLHEAVSAGNEFLQLKTSNSSNIRQMDCGGMEKSNTSVINRSRSTLKQEANVCWKCGQAGHMRRNCQAAGASESTQVNSGGQ